MLVYKNIFIILEVFLCAINCFFPILHFYNFSLRFILTFAFYNSAVSCDYVLVSTLLVSEISLLLPVVLPISPSLELNSLFFVKLSFCALLSSSCLTLLCLHASLIWPLRLLSSILLTKLLCYLSDDWRPFSGGFLQTGPGTA